MCPPVTILSIFGLFAYYFQIQVMLGYNITWKLGSTTMPENRYASAAIYSNDANCILIFGGFLIGTTDQKKNVWCYHVENDTFTTYDTLSSGYINQNGGGVFKISNKNNNNEEIYLWNGLDFELIKYNVLYKNSSIVTSNDDYSDTKYGCMVKHPTKVIPRTNIPITYILIK